MYCGSTMGVDTSSVMTQSGIWSGRWSEVCWNCPIDGSIATILHYWHGTKGLAYDVMRILEGTYWPQLHTSSYGTKRGSRGQVLTRDWVPTWTRVLLWCDYMSDELEGQSLVGGNCMCIQPRLSANEGRSAWARWQGIMSDDSQMSHKQDWVKGKIQIVQSKK